jgi:hypothetical protein
MRHRTCRLSLLIGLGLLLSGGSAFAADQLLFGKKLLIKNPPSGTTRNKVVHLAKDVTITLGLAGGSGDPQCAALGDGGAS